MNRQKKSDHKQTKQSNTSQSQQGQTKKRENQDNRPQNQHTQTKKSSTSKTEDQNLTSSQGLQSLQERYENLRLPSSYNDDTQEPDTQGPFHLVVDDALAADKDPLIENRELRSNNKRLQEELVEWQDKYSDLQRETERLQGEIQFLMAINQEFGDENDKLKKEVGEAKRQKIDHKTKKAGKMPIRQTESDIDEATTEPDEKGARNEMKAILKTLSPDKNLNYEQAFNSAQNITIRRQLIPELKKSLLPTYRPTVTQLSRWLNSLYKSRRSQLKIKQSGKIGEDQRRTHNNNRIQEKKFQRIKAAKSLYANKDERVTIYEKRELLKVLANRAFHSPELSETDDEENRVINVYDYSWRSDEV
ncbi:unnamed protein product [Rhizophagus irregularis]|nr:unnamed protein product [Rhizophagus irregularis]